MAKTSQIPGGGALNEDGTETSAAPNIGAVTETEAAAAGGNEPIFMYHHRHHNKAA